MEGPPYRPVISPAEVYAGTVQLYQVTADPHQPDGAVIFLGDSHTQGLAVDAVAPLAVNYGVGGLTTTGLLEVLPQLGSLRRARVVVLMIGSNDLPTDDLDGMEERLQAIAEAIPAPLVWHAIPPNRRFDPTQANERIEAVCAERPRCRFVRTRFGEGDFQPDGSHLSAAGYRKFISTLSAAAAASP